MCCEVPYILLLESSDATGIIGQRMKEKSTLISKSRSHSPLVGYSVVVNGSVVAALDAF